MSKQTLGFQAEVKQLLHLVVHSLYSNKEIFLRELISNAADAIDKLRFEGLTNPELVKDHPDFEIFIDVDKDAKLIKITDNGIGMSEDEVVNNLGTIAKSGTREFLANLSESSKSDTNLIGQFGVGFYSGFIVADKMTVETRRAGAAKNEAVRWSSDAESDFTVEPMTRDESGTTVILHLRDDQHEFLEPYRLRTLIKKYSDHIAVPIRMEKVQFTPPSEDGDDATEKEVKAPEFETVNQAKALWTRDKKDVKDEDYKEFFKHIAHEFTDPLTWSHNRVEGKMQYKCLLYCPSQTSFDFWQRDKPRGLKLFVKRVFIMDDAEQFLPLYLRFIKGVLDSDDLPLNISRELLQNNRTVEKLRSALTSRALSMLEKLSEDKEKYATFWKHFGNVLKEGPAEDFANKAKIAKLLRFTTSAQETNDQSVSLDDYIGRMKEGQEKIFYLTAENYETAKNSPHLEIFKQKGIEVLLLCDPIDEWLMSHLTEYSAIPMQSVAKGDLDLGKLEDEKEKEEQQAAEKAHKPLIERVNKVLKDDIKEARITHRLTSSPACVVADEQDLTGNMRRMLEAAGQTVPPSLPIFEVNPEHALVKKLEAMSDESQFEDWCRILFDQAMLTESGRLINPNQFVTRLNRYLESVN